MRSRSIVSLVAVLIVGIAIYFFGQPPVSKKDQSIFIVGTAAGYAPFVSVNPLGEYEGFDIDVAYAVAKKLGKKLEIKDLGSMTSLFMALDQGMIDAIIWGISITSERLEKVAMIHYQGETRKVEPLIFWKTIPEGIQSLADMHGKIVCVEPSSSHDTIIRKFPEIQTISIEKLDDALLQIQYGKADAAFVESAIAQKFKNKYPEIQILDVPLPLTDQVQGVGIVVKKDNQKLVDEIQKSTDDLKSEKLIEQSAKKWEIPS